MAFLQITQAEADTLRGNYGQWHVLDPVPLAETSDYILTDAVPAHPAFVGALDMLQALPTYAQWSGDGVSYSVGDIVEHGNRLKRVIQAHTSQPDWSPDATPALWVDAHRPGEIPDWVQPTGAHDSFPLGFLVRHNGQVWESLVSDNVWEPGAAGSESLWQVVDESGGEETDEWQANTAYAVNDEVTYNGTGYRCLQAHTSQVGWEPPAVPALWEPI